MKLDRTVAQPEGMAALVAMNALTAEDPPESAK
mgnify:CR=1 FL=1